MRKADKPLIVDKLAKQIQEAKSVTVLDYQGMPNKQLNELRQKVREASGIFTVSKNSLIKRAFEQAKVKIEPELAGPTAIIFAENDEVAPLQVLGKSIMESGLPRLKFGIFSSEFLGMEKVLALSKLPSKNVLLSRLLGTLIAPKYNLFQVLNANLQKLVYILEHRSKILSAT